jgi:hypothetical protein
MGLTILNALSLIDARRRGASFDATLTLGRVATFLAPRDVRRLARALPEATELGEIARKGTTPVYADFFFRALGAKTLDALDASDFEGASIIHDLNEESPAALRGRYDAVIDCGTLEHVFNLPAAFKLCMEALKCGGRFFAALPANNWCGHGFYQFSPEFFFRVFSADNGFESCRVWIAPCWVAGRWLDGPVFEVKDPSTVGERVEIQGTRTMTLLVEATKFGVSEVFSKWPQQSDYQAAWAAAGRQIPAAHPPARQYSVMWRLVKAILYLAQGVMRRLERIRERRRWLKQCKGNSALYAYPWKY